MRFGVWDPGAVQKQKPYWCSEGDYGGKDSNASKPPAEAPTPTIGKAFPGSDSSLEDVATSCGGFAGGFFDFSMKVLFRISFYYTQFGTSGQSVIESFHSHEWWDRIYSVPMFIRLKRIKLAKRSGYAPEYSLHAVLVESYRLDGKPRQRTLKYLGSIRESELKNHARKNRFLDVLHKRIRDLKLDPITSTSIRMKLIRHMIFKFKTHRD